jgi:hypothetical protein
VLDLLRAGCSVSDLQQITIGEAKILLEAWSHRRAARRKVVRAALKSGRVSGVVDVGREAE